MKLGWWASAPAYKKIDMPVSKSTKASSPGRENGRDNLFEVIMRRSLFRYEFIDDNIPHSFLIKIEDDGSLSFSATNLNIIPKSEVKRLVDALLAYAIEIDAK